MSNPYEAPGTQEEAVSKVKGKARNAPLVGCFSGGCLIPLVLFVICLIAGDVGGPLVWPLFCIVFGVFGLILGFIYRLLK
ncbi:hypothetical protein SAMN02745181_0219 [Rubritalea squalenifaciens DSM 18772]|uniref:Uncharacterized protein n=1 Tax=Rubritalea squalenifaciens DSM 18772 TaxID=1123071 RepID=A0A1M6BHC0_9BACT|nr:hypothetical protein SAMN02745181_0219 [Rubritalea squalenifaciens DSM 18772]